MTTGDENETASPNNDAPIAQKQMSPAVASSLLAVIAFGFVMYSTLDVMRSLLVAACGFVGVFWVMSQGQKLEAKRKAKKDQDSTA